jgi:membrane fusion protein (multidrug efflux system)
MKQLNFLIIASALVIASCGNNKDKDKAAQLAKLKETRAGLDVKIKELESEVNKNNPKKAIAIATMAINTTDFTSYIDVQSQIVGDENVLATPQAPGTVTNVLVHSGQKVTKGQLLATMDAAAVDQQIKATDVQITLLKSLYEKQKNLWAQNIGSEVQLLSAKANYEATLKQKDAQLAQRNMYRIISPISGTVDNVSLKQGDIASPGQSGIRVVSFDKLKVEASLGENYLGKVKAGDMVNLVFPDLNDSLNTKLSYVAQAVDPVSRAFTVQVKLGNTKKLYPNMSCKMRIANYQNKNALVVPVSVIQKTAEGDMLYIVEHNKAKAVLVTTGRNANGMVEILSGLKSGDNIISEGFGDVDNGEAVTIK